MCLLDIYVKMKSSEANKYYLMKGKYIQNRVGTPKTLQEIIEDDFFLHLFEYIYHVTF